MQQKAPRKRGFLFGRGKGKGKGTPPWPSPSLREREGKEQLQPQPQPQLQLQLQLQQRWSGPRCFMWVRPNKNPAFAGFLFVPAAVRSVAQGQ